MESRNRFHSHMRGIPRVVALLFCSTALVYSADEARLLAKVDSLPMALSDDFEFRKTKLYSLGEKVSPVLAASRKFVPGTRTRARAAVAEASLTFESRYRLFGAVTALDRRQRSGDYFDFFWRAKRDAEVNVRLEYRQAHLRSVVQAREIRYSNARGHHKTEFAIIGDDYFDDGAVIAWRCLLIENGRIVAENRSYLWR
jgi:hypothetical protein